MGKFEGFRIETGPQASREPSQIDTVPRVHLMGQYAVQGGEIRHYEACALEHEVAAILTTLPAAEQALASRFKGRRLRDFVAGRRALHETLRAVGCEREVALLVSDRGAPVVPTGYSGSIAHSRSQVVAYARPGSETVGVDLEDVTRFRSDKLVKRILTPAEQSDFGRLALEEKPERLATIFAAKEAIYKAVDPHVRRIVGFQEVTLSIAGEGIQISSPTLEADRVTVSVHVVEDGDPRTVLVVAIAGG